MKLIDKDALVAEIESLENTYKKCPTRNSYEDGLKEGRRLGYKDALYKIDSLEVKEVDFEKIINDYFKDWKFDEELDIMVKPDNYSATFDDIKEVAKHFFELGLSVNSKAQKGEEYDRQSTEN